MEWNKIKNKYYNLFKEQTKEHTVKNFKKFNELKIYFPKRKDSSTWSPTPQFFYQVPAKMEQSWVGAKVYLLCFSINLQVSVYWNYLANGVTSFESFSIRTFTNFDNSFQVAESKTK